VVGRHFLKIGILYEKNGGLVSSITNLVLTAKKGGWLLVARFFIIESLRMET